MAGVRKLRRVAGKVGRFFKRGMGLEGASCTSNSRSRDSSVHGSTKSIRKSLSSASQSVKAGLSRRWRSWKKMSGKDIEDEDAAAVPEGYFSVEVGDGQDLEVLKTRYVIPTEYLNHVDLKKLLDEAVEEFEYQYQSGVLQLACNVDKFEGVLDKIRVTYADFVHDESAQLLN